MRLRNGIGMTSSEKLRELKNLLDTVQSILKNPQVHLSYEKRRSVNEVVLKNTQFSHFPP